MKKREYYIDSLKVLGLLCIILAHVNPPGIVFQLRNFDVILMILISAYLGMKSYKKCSDSKKYYIKRFKRLVLPTWIFLVFLFVVLIIITPDSITINKIVDSFILNDGIGYVWIIRIYLIVAILIPLCYKLVNKLRMSLVLILSTILYVAYEIAYYVGLFEDELLLYLFAYIIPCFFLIIVSYYLFNEKKAPLYSTIINFIIFVIIGYIIYEKTGSIKSTQIQKYPFRAYYISYSLLVSSILLQIAKSKKICFLLNNKIICFLSSHSLWIYLWHILFVVIYEKVSLNWLVKYIVILSSAVVVVFVQSIIVKKIDDGNKSRILELFIG